jgi:hypothetical protein
VVLCRNFVRNARRRLFQAKPKHDSNFFKVVKTTYFTFLPFIEGSLFYFETIKVNILLFHFLLCPNKVPVVITAK